MSAINLHNYEGFLLDYSEGALSAEEIRELRTFLISHPELEIDPDELQLPYFSPERVSFDAKENLKKIESDQYNESLLYYLENKLSEEERADLEQRLSSEPLFASELEQYKKTILVPDEHIVFNNKANVAKTEEDLFHTEAFKLVAFTENSLTAGERFAFEKVLLQRPELRKELALLVKTQLKSDLTIVFPHKEQLKKKNRVFALYSTKNILRMAAAILLLISFSFLLSYYGDEEQKKLTSRATVEETNNSLKLSSNANKRETDFKGINLQQAEPTVAIAVRFPKSGTTERKQPLASPPVVREMPQLIAELERKGEMQINTNIVPPPEVEKIAATDRASKETKQGVDSINTSQFYQLALEEDDENTNDSGEAPNTTKGFWQKAVTLAQQANKLGIKSVDGVEDTHRKFRLSINNFSVEKR